MNKYFFRMSLIIGFIALSVFLLYPTFKDSQNQKSLDAKVSAHRESLQKSNAKIEMKDLDKKVQNFSDSLRSADPSMLETRKKRIKLGLDLQGGMRVVLEVNTAKLLDKLAQNQDDNFKDALSAVIKEAEASDANVVDLFVKKMAEKNLRLSKYFGSVRDDDKKIIDDLKKKADESVDRAQEILRNRIDQYGVAEPVIQKQGSRRISVELPGIANEEEARQLIQSTALLEFKLLKEPQTAFDVMTKIDKALGGKFDDTEADTTKKNAKADTSKTAAKEKATAQKDDKPKGDTAKKQLTKEEFAQQHPFFGVAIIPPNAQTAEAYVTQSDRPKLENMLARPEIQKILDEYGVQFSLSAKPFTFAEGKPVYLLYCVNKSAELTGGVITSAVGMIDPQSSSAMVTMAMNTDGSLEWARITGSNINKRMAIVLDGLVYSAPNIKNKISGGRSQIEGMKDLKEAQNLAIILNAGAFSAPVDIIEERTVGPSLGEDSVSQGVNSSLYGYLLVAGFMIFYYMRSGSIAALGLVFTVLFLLGTLAGFGATLTLPGIAGIVLTMGMAVDNNVLVFERIREELGTGKTIKSSIDAGFQKAGPAIWDTNITTFFTGVILYQFGTGPVQGFALTLMIGIATAMFSTLLISKLIFEVMVNKGMKITVG